MPEKVLSDDWSDYDNKKKTGGSDARNFACTESWEINYLINKIRKHNPQYSESAVRDAIAVCCKETKTPHPRKLFVECVMKRLR